MSTSPIYIFVFKISLSLSYIYVTWSEVKFPYNNAKAWIYNKKNNLFKIPKYDLRKLRKNDSSNDLLRYQK